MADQDFIVRSLKEKLAETQNELNQLKDKSDAYVSELNDAGKKQHECERRVQELHNNLEECRKYMRLSLFRLTHAAAEKNKQTEDWLIDAEEFRQKAEEGQATFNNLKAETDYLLHNLKSREKQVDNLENMIYSLKDIMVKSQTELSQVQVNATHYLKDKEAAERAQAQYRESIHLMKEALHLGQQQKDISLEKIMSISQEEVELNKPISSDLDSYTKVFEHNIIAPDDTKEEMNKILETIKLKDKQIKSQDQRITALSQLLEEAQMNINKIQKIANVHTNMEQEYEAKINKLQKELIESKKQIEDLQKVEKKQENKLLDPQSVEIIYENKTDALSRATLELNHMELMLHQREQEVKNQDELIKTLKNCLQTATQELNLLYKKVGLKIPLTLAEEDDKLFILESQLKAANEEIREHIGKVEALQSEVTLSSNEQEMMINNLFSTLHSLDKQVQLQNEIIKLLGDFIQKAQNEHQELLLKCNTLLVPKVSSVGEHKSMLQMKLKSYEVQLQAQEELINILKESLEKAHQELEEAIRETKSERRLSLQRREQTDSQKVVSLQSSVNQLKREMVKYQDMITTLEEKEQLPVSQSMDIRQALLQRKVEAQDRQIEAQGQMIQSYKDALKQTQQEFQELIKDADLTKQLEIQTLKSEGEKKVEELQTVLKEVQLDLVKLQSLEQSKISSISQSQFTFLTSQMEKYQSQINTQDEMIRVLRGSMQRAMDEYEDIIRTNKNHQVSTDETKHLNQQRIRELEDKLNETKEKLLSNQAQIEMLEREKSLPKSYSVQLHNALLMSELEASERKVNTQAALISALEDSAKKIKEEYDQTLTKIKAEDLLTMEQLKLEEQYKIQGLQETLEKAHKQLVEQTSLPKSRSIIERNNTLKAALDSRNEQIDAQNEIIDALRNTIQKIKQDYGEIINKAQKEIKASSEEKEKEFEQRINELNNELIVANKKMNTYQAQIKAFEEKEVPVKSQSLEMLNALLTSKLETSEKKAATQSELIHALQESIQRTKEENLTIFERRSGKYVTFEDAQQMDDYKMQTLQEVSSKIQGQIKEQSHLPEATSSQLHNTHLVSQLETYDKQIDTQREMIALLQNSLQKAKDQLQENFQIKTQVRDNLMTESRQETEETIQELESSLLKVQDELTKYKELGEVLEKEGAIPDNQSFEILDILLASKLHTAEAQVFMECMRDACEDVIGVQLDKVNVKVLLYADDVLTGEKESDSQNALNHLSVATDRMDILLNVSKTKVEDQTELIKVLMETISLTATESKALLKETKSDRRPSLEEKQIQDENMVLQLQTQLKDIQQDLHKTITLNQEDEKVKVGQLLRSKDLQIRTLFGQSNLILWHRFLKDHGPTDTESVSGP
uniref:Uncharacterized protein n=1 Tax=Timema poppense TaxID=170557 RepID=A0A7R9GS08_TIMPO|nr:unnamed protein product [Timema poppensis]